jgi:DNA-binding LytR/AlgR family response regulator
MNILIVEDEELAAKKLAKAVTALDEEAHIMGVTDSIQTTVDWLEEHPRPDLILMDIELTDGQSFEIFNLTEVKSPVIFTTSYDEFALKAFKVNSVDYLLKPIQKEDLQAALDKYRRLKQAFAQPVAAANANTAETGTGAGVGSLEQIIRELQQKLQPKEYRKRFLVKQGQKLISIETEEIAYFYSDGRVNFFKTADNRKYITDYTMEELEEMLDPVQFHRISRSFYVSIKSVAQIHDYFGNRLILELKPTLEKDAIVSREKVADFKKWMGK